MCAPAPASAEVAAGASLFVAYLCLAVLTWRLWFVERSLYRTAIVGGVALLPSAHFTHPLRQFVRDVAGIPFWKDGKLHSAAIAQGGCCLFRTLRVCCAWAVPPPICMCVCCLCTHQLRATAAWPGCGLWGKGSRPRGRANPPGLDLL